MYYNVFMFHCMYTTDLKNRTGLRGTLGFLVLQELLLFFMRYFSNFAASVQYFVLSIQTVSVFIEFSPRYCGISQFSPSYCGSEYPPPPPNAPLIEHLLLGNWSKWWPYWSDHLRSTVASQKKMIIDILYLKLMKGTLAVF